MVQANLTHFGDLLDYGREWWAEPSALTWGMEMPPLSAFATSYRRSKLLCWTLSLPTSIRSHIRAVPAP